MSTMTKKESRIAAQKLIAALKGDLSYMVEGKPQISKDVLYILLEGMQQTLAKTLLAVARGTQGSLDLDRMQGDYFATTDAKISILWSEHDLPCTLNEFRKDVDVMRGFIHRVVTRPRKSN